MIKTIRKTDRKIPAGTLSRSGKGTTRNTPIIRATLQTGDFFLCSVGKTEASEV